MSDWKDEAKSVPSPQLNRDQLLRMLSQLQYSGDAEAVHYEADLFLLSYIADEDITRAFLSLKRWYA